MLTTKKVLIIEDSKFVHKVLQDKFQDIIMQSTSVYSLKEALEILKKETFDFIVLDLNLPDAFGRELLYKIQKVSDGAKIIVLTVEKDPVLRESLFMEGIYDYIIKDRFFTVYIEQLIESMKSIESHLQNNILVIDDSKYILNQMKKLLEIRDYKVILAQNATEGLDALSTNAISTIVLDLELPDINGIDVLKEIKTNGEYKNIPIIILSDNTDRGIVRECLKLGSSDFIQKPFHAEEFILKIDHSIELYEQSKALRELKNRYKADYEKVSKLNEVHEEELKRLAYFDSLTGLANRVLFMNTLSHEIATAKRSGNIFAVFYMDLDKFKDINDSLGHDIGDEVLIQTAQKLRQTMREEDTIARLGGDEFTIILHEINSPEDASLVAQKLITAFNEPMQLSEEDKAISISIGIAIYPQDGQDASSLIKHADMAMYEAKESGRNTFNFYSKSMGEKVLHKIKMENELKNAIQNHEITAYYQPQFDIKNNKIRGIEALARWIHPSKGVIKAEEFIQIAKENRIIKDIDKLVINDALKQFVKWKDSCPAPSCKLLLNISSDFLNDDGFLEYFRGVVSKIGLDIGTLEVEVLESELTKDFEHSTSKLKELQKEHINITLDDFGTGLSSVASLKKLPVNALKIDRSLINNIYEENENERMIVKAIISLGASFQLNIYAEGVETALQKNFLSQNDCDAAQGYLYIGVLSTDEMTDYLQSLK